ncbi:MAG: hypothetical protein H7834_01700 [Magnetococcus sp. YQC-9]
MDTPSLEIIESKPSHIAQELLRRCISMDGTIWVGIPSACEELSEGVEPPMEIIAGTLKQLERELSERRVSSDRPIWLAITSRDEEIPGRVETRMRVVASGIHEDDLLDELIEEAREEVYRARGERSYPVMASA